MKTGTLITIGVVVLLGAWIAFWAIGLSNTYNKYISILARHNKDD